MRWLPKRGAASETSEAAEIELRARQIKEIVRLGSTLRVDMSPQDIFQQVVTSIHHTLGFGVAAINLVQEQSDTLAVVATAGLSTDDLHRLVASRPSRAGLDTLMDGRFRISNSYFIGHEHQDALARLGITVYGTKAPNAAHPPDAWHPDDMLLVPLLSPRDGRMFGVLSLDQPEDGRRPSEETIEVIEIFAHQAAMAIENARVFEEREHERRALAQGLEHLLGLMQQVRQGDLSVRSAVQGGIFSPIGTALNAVLTTLGTLLAEVREAALIVDATAGDTRTTAAHLATTSQEQARNILEVSGEIETLATSLARIAQTATAATDTALEGIEVSTSGREFAEQAAIGMQGVRGMVIESANKIKRLGEHTQEIGQIVQTVSAFAHQTNLLALNAAIEAARAESSGASALTLFAAEIRTLANNSEEAARQIATRIATIQGETNAVVVTIEHSTEQVLRQSELASQAGAALEAVDLAAQRVASAIHAINATATQQAQTARNISAAVADIAAVSASGRDDMEGMRGAMDALVERANILLRKIRYFRLPGPHPTRPNLDADQTPHQAAPLATPLATPTDPSAQPRLTQPLQAIEAPERAAPSHPLPSPPPRLTPLPPDPTAPEDARSTPRPAATPASPDAG